MADIWYLRDAESTADAGPVRRHGAEAVFAALGWQGIADISPDPAGHVRARPKVAAPAGGPDGSARRRVVVRIALEEAEAVSRLVPDIRRLGAGFYTWPDLAPQEAERRFDAFGLPRKSRET